MNTVNKVLMFSKNNIRYGFILLVFGLIFFINTDFPAKVTTTESCQDGNCKSLLQNSNLTDERPVFYINNILESGPNEYYRLVFHAKSNQSSKLIIRASDPIDKDKEIKTINTEKTLDDSLQEILFSTDRKYTDIVFEKYDKSDGAEIYVSGVQVSKLNVSSDQEASNLKPTIKSSINFNVPAQVQSDNSKYFTQLMQPQMIFGEVFQARDDYISGVSLDFDIISQSNNGGKKYKLDLRNVDYEEGSILEIKSDALSRVEFSVKDLEKYRQENGKFLFPLFAKLDKGSYYFVGINNDRIETNKFNYLKLKGTSDGEKFKNGTLAVKTKGQSYSVVGDLYFATYGINFNEYNGKKILRGSVIEDIGKGKGIFKYHPRRDVYDFVDLESYSSDIDFDENRMVLVGSIGPENDPKKESNFVYKFETIFPSTKFHITAKQADLNWSDVSISYSYDQSSWREIPSSKVSEDILNNVNNDTSVMQIFDYEISENIPKDKIFIKISPQNPSADKERYGIKDFEVAADLIMK